MQSRQALAAILFVVILNVCAEPLLASESTRQPNVVIIVADDLGWNDVSYQGSDIQTPNIDRLANEGVRLDRFYTYPICSKTRAALMTGISADRTGVSNRCGLPLRYRTLPEVFLAAGYQTWLCGKWHLGGMNDGEGVEFHPNQRGFVHFYGHLGGAVNYWQHVNHGSGKHDWQRNGRQIREGGYTTNLLANEAVSLIESRDSRPFLLVLAFNAVHQPLQSPTNPDEATRHVDVGSRKIYREMTEAMDTAIGRVLDSIVDQGERANTLVVLLSDNGGLEGHAASNAPLRGGKGYVFDGGIRVPAVMCWPGVLPKRAMSHQLMWIADVLPTVAAAADTQVRDVAQLDGMDLWTGIRDQNIANRDGFVINMGRRGWAYLGEHWKLMHVPETADTHLFRIVDDPSETQDVAESHPQTVRELTAHAQQIAPAGTLRIEAASGEYAQIILLTGFAGAGIVAALVVLLAARKRRFGRKPAIRSHS